MSATPSKNGRRFDEEFKREVAALASRPGASDEQVGRDLGVSAWSVARWRRRFGVDKSSGVRTSAAGANLPSVGGANNASVAELERRIKALERENADLREQRSILKKAVALFKGDPAVKIGVIRKLAGEHSVRKLCRTLEVTRSAYYAAEKKQERPRARANARLGTKISELFEASGRTYGSPRLTVALRRAGERCGRHRVARLMRGRGLRARQKKRFRPRTTDSRHLSVPSPPTCWRNVRRPRAPTKSGRRTSPMWPPKRVGFTSPAFWMHVRAASSAGRPMTPCPPPWSPAPSLRAVQA